MPVDTPSKDYTAQKDAWAKTRALMSGEDAARELVAKLPGMDDTTFDRYKNRASYLPVMERTVDMFDGLLFFRDPQVKMPESMTGYVEDITMDGTSAVRFASQVANEVLQVSRVGVLVDYPAVPEGPSLTVADAEARGLRASARLYKTEDILFVEYGRVGGARKLTQVRVKEIREARDPADEFTMKQAPIIRVLEIVGGAYQQRVFVWNETTRKWEQEGGEIVPRRGGARLGFIPMAFFSHKDREGIARRPALSALADVSASHLNTSALLEWGLMWTANPTPVFVGVAPPATDERGECAEDDETNAIRLGSSEGITLPVGGEAYFMEFAGAGLKAVADSMEHKEKHMARIGARALMDDPREAVAAETARIQRASDHSLLGSIAAIVSEGMTWILWELAAWAKVTLKAGDGLQLNRNFLPTTIAPEELKQLVSAFQSGVISSSDLFARLQAGELIRDGKTFEEHQAEIEEDGNAAALEDQNVDPKAVAA